MSDNVEPNIQTVVASNVPAVDNASSDTPTINEQVENVGEQFHGHTENEPQLNDIMITESNRNDISISNEIPDELSEEIKSEIPVPADNVTINTVSKIDVINLGKY